MTGCFPTKTGIYGFQNWAGREDFKSYITLPEYFHKNGYVTFSSGKIHHKLSWAQSYVEINCASTDPDPAVVVPRADREWTVNNIAAVLKANDHHIPCLEESIDWHGNRKVRRMNSLKYKCISGPSDDSVMDCKDGVTAQFGVDVLKQKHDKPFFLALGFKRPHLPFIAPRKYFDHYPLGDLKLHPVKEDDLADKPWVARRNARVTDDINIRKTNSQGRARVIQAYYACVSFLDDMVGMVLNELERSSYVDNTIIVLWSDHGWHLGEKRSWRKFSLWEESVRVPLILVDPRRTKSAGQTCQRPVGLIDLYPTLTELCGLPMPANLNGVSLCPLLEDPDADSVVLREPELTVLGRGNYSLRDEEWRYTRYFDGSEELYKHKDDPYEWTNLAHDSAYNDIKEYFSYLLPADSAPAVEPRGRGHWADLDKDDIKQFKTNVWSRWIQEATPPLL